MDICTGEEKKEAAWPRVRLGRGGRDGVEGAMAEWVRALACAGDRTVRIGFESRCGKLCFGTLAIPFTPLCQCLSEETLKAVGPLYLVSMPGEVKDPTSPHWNV